MPSRIQQVVLAVLAAVVAVGVGALGIASRKDAEVEVDETALARARTLHARQQTPTPGPAASRATRAPRPRPARAAEPDLEPAAEEAPRRSGLPPGIPQPTLSGPRIGDKVEELAVAMDEANKLYDRGDYIAALEAAEAILQTQPNNVRVLRIAVSSHCILGNADDVTRLWDRLPSRDQRQLARRCERYGVELDVGE